MADPIDPKHVDEGWKKRAQAEKEKLQERMDQKRHTRESARRVLPDVNFSTFAAGLAAQALVGLGQLENPVSGKREVDLEQAKYTIDVLRMLQEKTRGSLNSEEKAHLDGLLYELQLAFVQVSGGGARPAPGGRASPITGNLGDKPAGRGTA